MPPTITVPQAHPAPNWQRVRAAWSDIRKLLSLQRRGGIPMVFIGMTEWFSCVGHELAVVDISARTRSV
jgi:hypothetical protein